MVNVSQITVIRGVKGSVTAASMTAICHQGQIQTFLEAPNELKLRAHSMLAGSGCMPPLKFLKINFKVSERPFPAF